jgi:hypothetical protein
MKKKIRNGILSFLIFTPVFFLFLLLISGDPAAMWEEYAWKTSVLGLLLGVVNFWTTKNEKQIRENE